MFREATPGDVPEMADLMALAADADWPTVGVALLDHVKREARRRGAVQVVVVCAHLDETKRAALASAGLKVTSEWWTEPL